MDNRIGWKDDRIGLGDTARDKISGFVGIVIGDVHWLYACRRLVLQPQILHDGRPVEAQTFDEPQLELVERKTVVYDPPIPRTGGNRPDPPRR